VSAIMFLHVQSQKYECASKHLYSSREIRDIIIEGGESLRFPVPVMADVFFLMSVEKFA